jgi:N-acetylglucosaminyldiphosphoundecaprenol N-acetyl-beta-D-mannosaminyltransferase
MPVPQGAGVRSIHTANLDHIVQLSRDASFREAYSRAWLVTADGMPVYIYGRLRRRGATRVPGSDLFCALLPALPAETARCFFVASDSETASRLADYLVRRGFPAESVSWAVPPQGFESDPQQSERLIELIRAHGTTHLFLGVGAPKSEVWIDRYRDRAGDCYALCIGASLEFFAGTRRRAPVWMRRGGLEWLFRVLQEPRRLWRRYFLDSWGFLRAVLRDLTQGADARQVPESR